MMFCEISLTIFVACVICCSAAKVDAPPRQVSGPYVSVLKRYGMCKSPSMPYAKKRAINMDVIIKKNNILRGNLTVIENTFNLKTTFREYYYEEGKWQITFNANNISCRNSLIRALAEFLGITYDKKTCAAPKTSFIFEVDYNRVDHLWMTSREYGRLLRTIEVRGKGGTVMCAEFESLVKPAKP